MIKDKLFSPIRSCIHLKYKQSLNHYKSYSTQGLDRVNRARRATDEELAAVIFNTLQIAPRGQMVEEDLYKCVKQRVEEKGIRI